MAHRNDPNERTLAREAETEAAEAPVVVAIDDEPMVLLMISKALAAEGMVCRTATTGAAGLELIRSCRPCLVLLDLKLVGEDGFQVCREIRRTWSSEELPVVMVTGLEDLPSIQAAYQAGANDFLIKPLHWQHLPYRVRHVLQSAEAVQNLKERTWTLRSLFAVHPDPIFAIDAKEEVTLVHSGLRGSMDTLPVPLGLLGDLLPSELAGKVQERLRSALRAPEEVICMEAPFRIGGRNRAWEARFVASAEDQVLVVVRDITEREAFEQKIKHMAYHDVLTGLWNRHALSSTLERVSQDVQRSQGTPFPVSAALLYLDLDNFKRVNDTLGHSFGDGLLKVVAARIGDVLRPSDVLARAESGDIESVARIGGDEFCLVLTGLSSPVDAGRVAQRILELLRQPIRLEGHELVMTPSIGIALIPQDGRDPDTLLKNADRAMYAAKEAGRNRFQFFDPSMETQLLERFALENGIRRGLAKEEFRVHFQPVIDARTGTILGMEALLRWDDPELGAIAPAKFIPVAEETGLIVELGEFVFREALSFNRKLRQEGLPTIRVAVNLSSSQMLDPQLIARIEACIALTGVDASSLEVELTESLLLEGSGRGLVALRRMKDLGITITLDDFGTGYSSLTHLHEYPFDNLKIDREFVHTVCGPGRGRSVASTIIAMAKTLGMEVVAEGVEDLDQASFLLARGCNKAQGFLYGRPMSPQEFRAFYWQRLGRASEA
jgi:diguanylate cyclase (GGDEF)-like protein